MILFGGSCEQCDFDSSCSHQKLLWDGKQFTQMTACCRTGDGITFYHKGYDHPPVEAMDWYLWATIGQKEKVYGREQFILEDDRTITVCDNNSVRHHTPIVAKEEIKPLVLKGPRLASVYAEADNTQGSLF